MTRLGRSSFPIALILTALTSWVVAADKLDGNDKKWLAQVSALIQPDEQSVFRNIPKAERLEFQAIFWARRNPEGASAQTNEFKERFLLAVAEADKKFTVPGRAGASTDCGRVYLVMGPPDDVRPALMGAATLDGADAFSVPGRKPEIWTYKDRPGLTFPAGKASMVFDERCELPLGSNVRQQLPKMAAARIVSQDVKPEIGADGRLVPLADQLKRRRTPAQMLFVNPRHDFAFEREQELAMRVPLGAKLGTYVAGLLRVPVAGLAVKEDAGKKKVALFVATQLADSAGNVMREMSGQRAAEVNADGIVVISYSTMGTPGSYTLRIAVADSASDKGAVAETPITLPDFSSSELRLSDPQIFAGIDPVEQADQQDPLADFLMGSVRLVPRFGNVFKKSESVQLLCMGYNAALDSTTHKASVVARFDVLKGDKVLTTSNEMTIDTADSIPSLGPVPLSGVEPGTYQVRAVVSDRVAKKELTTTATYQVVP